MARQSSQLMLEIKQNQRHHPRAVLTPMHCCKTTIGLLEDGAVLLAMKRITVLPLAGEDPACCVLGRAQPLRHTGINGNSSTALNSPLPGNMLLDEYLKATQRSGL